MDAERRSAETLARHRRILVKMLFKVTAYYAVLAGAVAIAGIELSDRPDAPATGFFIDVFHRGFDPDTRCAV